MLYFESSQRDVINVGLLFGSWYQVEFVSFSENNGHSNLCSLCLTYSFHFGVEFLCVYCSCFSDFPIFT